MQDDIEQDIREILSYAVWAPSGDNSQPWKFKLKGSLLEVYNLPDKDLPFFNFEQRGSLAAHGALLENIKIASGHFGLNLEIKTFPESAEPNLIARVEFTQTEKNEHPLFGVIKERHTNRKAYKKIPLTPEQRESILSVQKDFPNCKIILAEDEEQRRMIGKASAEMERIVLNDEKLHGPFFSHVVWTEEEERRVKTGLYAKSMELPGPKGLIFKLASKWSRMKYLAKLGLPNLIAADNSKAYAASAAFVAIVFPTNTPRDFFETGRVMQNIWLRATSLGLSAHPVSGILFLMQRVFAGKTEGLTEEQIQKIKDAYRQIKDAYKLDQGYITFILRVGKSNPPSGRCSRLDPVIESI
jgi:nitroreductase